jgi:hypothetical protein
MTVEALMDLRQQVDEMLVKRRAELPPRYVEVSWRIEARQ